MTSSSLHHSASMPASQQTPKFANTDTVWPLNMAAPSSSKAVDVDPPSRSRNDSTTTAPIDNKGDHNKRKRKPKPRQPKKVAGASASSPAPASASNAPSTQPAKPVVVPKVNLPKTSPPIELKRMELDLPAPAPASTPASTSAPPKSSKPGRKAKAKAKSMSKEPHPQPATIQAAATDATNSTKSTPSAVVGPSKPQVQHALPPKPPPVAPPPASASRPPFMQPSPGHPMPHQHQTRPLSTLNNNTAIPTHHRKTKHQRAFSQSTVVGDLDESAAIPRPDFAAATTKTKESIAELKRRRRDERARAQRQFERASSTGSIERSEQVISLMNKSGSRLSQQVQALVDSQAPTAELVQVRKEIIAMMERALNSVNFWWGQPHSNRHNPIRIAPFGSNAFGLSTASSDLDLCVLDPYRPSGWMDRWDHDKLPALYNIRRVGEILQRSIGKKMSKMLVIKSAAVQIVKFEIEHNGYTIQGDLNINERLGILNSALVNTYCELHPQVRPLASFVKFWASQRALKDSSGRKGPISFSSYTLILLVIAFMQSRSLLPNLQDCDLLKREGVEPSAYFSTPRRIFDNGQPKWRPPIGWDTTFLDRAPVGYEPPEVNGGADDLEELVKGFFDWMTEFPFESRVVSIERGGSFARQRHYDEYVVGQLADQIQRTRAERSKADEKRRAKLKQAASTNADTSATSAAMLALDTDHSVGNSSVELNVLGDVDLGDLTMHSETSNDERLLQQLFPPTKMAQSGAKKDLPAAATTLLGNGDRRANSKRRGNDEARRALKTLEGASIDDDSERDDSRSNGSSAPFKSGTRHDDRPATPELAQDRFEEPLAWSQRIIVQDPFLRTRNTAKNVSSAVASIFLEEVRRAAILLHAGEPIETICGRISVAELKERHKAIADQLDETDGGEATSHRQLMTDEDEGTDE